MINLHFEHRSVILFLLLLIAYRFVWSVTVSGIVRSKKTGEPLAYVNVILKDKNIGTQTNSKGYYVISDPEAGKLKNTLLTDFI